MRNTTPRVIIIAVIAIVIIVFIAKSANYAPQPSEPITPAPTTPEITTANQNIVLSTSSPVPVTPVPTETYLKPSYTPSLRGYEDDESGGFKHARNPSSYIMSDNEWVKYYASQLFIDDDGSIKYKDSKYIAMSIPVEGGNRVIYGYKSFVNNYITDNEQFNNPPNGNYWVNPDYYLTHEMKGDCEDFALTITSMMLSGEMSLKQGDNFVKQIVPAKTVLGYTSLYNTNRIGDAWVVYEINGKEYIANSQARAIADLSSNPKLVSITRYILIDSIKYGGLYADFEPIYEFTDKYFSRV